MNKETILAIDEINRIFFPSCSPFELSGFCVTTSKRKIYLLIDSVQYRCEQWGYLSTPDDLQDFIGAELIRFENRTATDTTILRHGIEAKTQFITIYTSKGEITFTVYNSHNGFYSHGAYIIEGTLQLLSEVRI